MIRTLTEELQLINSMAGQAPQGQKPAIDEAENGFDSQFITKNVDTDIYYLSSSLGIDAGEDVDTSNSGSVVTWKLDPDIRSYGIKSMGVMVLSVSVSIEWEVITADNTPSRKGVIEFNTQDPKFKNWAIESDMDFAKDGGCYPINVTLDWQARKISVT